MVLAKLTNLRPELLTTLISGFRVRVCGRGVLNLEFKAGGFVGQMQGSGFSMVFYNIGSDQSAFLQMLAVRPCSNRECYRERLIP